MEGPSPSLPLVGSLRFTALSPDLGLIVEDARTGRELLTRGYAVFGFPGALLDVSRQAGLDLTGCKTPNVHAPR